MSSQQQLDEADSTTPPSSGVFWPTRLLPTAIPNINVHTWGYDADIDGFWSSASQNTVARHAASLLSDLADLLESGEPNVLPIIFVVHSLGGIVLKAVRQGLRLMFIARADQKTGPKPVIRDEGDSTKQNCRQSSGGYLSRYATQRIELRVYRKTRVQHHEDCRETPKSQITTCSRAPFGFT